jgi:hypothetical protein
VQQEEIAEVTPVDSGVPPLSQDALNQIGIQDLSEVFTDERELLALFQAPHGKSTSSRLETRASGFLN